MWLFRVRRCSIDVYLVFGDVLVFVWLDCDCGL